MHPFRTLSTALHCVYEYNIITRGRHECTALFEMHKGLPNDNNNHKACPAPRIGDNFSGWLGAMMKYL